MLVLSVFFFFFAVGVRVYDAVPGRTVWLELGDCLRVRREIVASAPSVVGITPQK